VKQVYDVPAILSFLFPGLGQLVKEQYNRAAMIWGAMLMPWLIWLLVAAVSGNMIYDPETIILSMVRSPLFPVVSVLNLTVHLWQVVDAYNCPRDFDLS